MAPETHAFDALPEQDRLPPHPPLDMMLRGEDGATHQLPRFGGARGSHRALPSYKFLMTEKLRIASHAQLRASGAPRVHAMLRAHASCFSSLVFTAYSAGIVSDAALEAADGPQAYALLCAVFSLGAARLHCREIEVAAKQRASASCASSSCASACSRASSAASLSARACWSCCSSCAISADESAAASKKDAATFFRFDMDVGRSRGVDHCMFRPLEEVDNAQSRSKSH